MPVTTNLCSVTGFPPTEAPPSRLHRAATLPVTPDHVYAEPNPECDAKIASLMSQLYSLESSARSDVSSAIQSAKDEYHALPASQRTLGNKVSIAYSHLSSVESTYDSAVSSVVSEMRSVLREYNQPETVADQAWSYYQSAKSSMISSLGG